MAIHLDISGIRTTREVLANVLSLADKGQRVQFLVEAGVGTAMVQRMRVALSRSRERNKRLGRKINEFSLRHEIYPFTKSGKRHDCIVMWVEKNIHHRKREIIDDILERKES